MQKAVWNRSRNPESFFVRAVFMGRARTNLLNSACLSLRMATIEDFQKPDIRVGKIVEVEDFPLAKRPTYKLKIYLGEIGIKKSCAQLCANYGKEDLQGKLVLCVVNFPPRQIGPVASEVLTLGGPGENKECVLIQPDGTVPQGAKLF
jgi:tRNA-binding protein